MRAAVTFIIPTVRDREDLRERALNSLLAQTDPDWLAVVCGDGFLPDLPFDARHAPLTGPPTESAGLTRNFAIENARLAHDLGQWNTDWLAFLDDDDTVSEEYVELLKEVEDAADLVVFRMFHRELGVLPDQHEPSLTWGKVGISFAVRAHFMWRNGLEFIKENVLAVHPANEDIHFLRACNKAGARVLLHPSIAYFVKDQRP